jgi:hypothetical protein
MNAKPSTWIFQFYFMTPAASRYEFVAHPLEKKGKKNLARRSASVCIKNQSTLSVPHQIVFCLKILL